jgi:cellobiose-specific phosphotransferase system component IIB
MPAKFPKKNIFVTLSCVSLGSLFCSFGGAFERFEIYKQFEFNQFNQEYHKTFILSETQLVKPYGFDASKSEKIASIYEDAKVQKIMLLCVAVISSSLAIMIGDIVEDVESDSEVLKIETTSKRQLRMEKIKHQFAMMSLAQRELFKSELQELLELSGGDSTMEASELNATDKFLNANYLIAEGHDIDSAIAMTWGFDKGSPEFEDMKLKFNEWLVS